MLRGGGVAALNGFVQENVASVSSTVWEMKRYTYVYSRSPNWVSSYELFVCVEPAVLEGWPAAATGGAGGVTGKRKREEMPQEAAGAQAELSGGENSAVNDFSMFEQGAPGSTLLCPRSLVPVL
jgi:hypothetical protein